jgi:hypothetical protein
MVLVYGIKCHYHAQQIYWYLKIILLDKFVLNIAEISIHFNSDYLRCLCVDVRLQNKNTENQSQF